MAPKKRKAAEIVDLTEGDLDGAVDLTLSSDEQSLSSKSSSRHPAKIARTSSEGISKSAVSIRAATSRKNIIDAHSAQISFDEEVAHRLMQEQSNGGGKHGATYDADEELARRLMEEEQLAVGSRNEGQSSYEDDMKLALQLSKQFADEAAGAQESSVLEEGREDMVVDEADADAALAKQLQEEERAAQSAATSTVADQAPQLKSDIHFPSVRSSTTVYTNEISDAAFAAFRTAHSAPPTCPTCQTAHPVDSVNLLIYPQRKEGPTEYLLRMKSCLLLKCSTCSTIVCQGCREKADAEEASITEGNHCAASRLFLAYALLHFVYTRLTQSAQPESCVPAAEPSREKSSKRQSKATKSEKAKTFSSSSGGVGYGTDDGSLDYYPGRSKGMLEANTAKQKLDEAEQALDRVMATSFEELAALLPNPNRNPEPFTFDFLPHPGLESLLAKSCFLPVVSIYLVNVSFHFIPVDKILCPLASLCNFVITTICHYQKDSFIDVSKRSNLYFPLVKLVELLSGHETLLPLLVHKHPQPNPSQFHPANDTAVKSISRHNSRTGTRPHIFYRLVSKETATSASTSRKRPLRSDGPPGDTTEEDSADETDTAIPDTTVPLLELLQRLITQANVFTKSAQNKDFLTGDDEDTVQVIGLAAELADAWGKIHQSVDMWKGARKEGGEGQQNEDGKGKGKGKGKATTRNEDAGEGTKPPYIQTMQEHIFAYTKLWSHDHPPPTATKNELEYDDDYSDDDHYSDEEDDFPDIPLPPPRGRSGKAVSTMAPNKRILHLAKETATLSTSLPCNEGSSVFVRVDDSKIDAMKCLITGPEGTPYSNGCFEFDIAFPDDYPAIPPKVKLKTTGGGTVRFNPNLYQCGKVCLSLLGTWHGAPSEMWQTGANQSTLLQVLMSIQSMILVDLPYYNEPGMGQARKDDDRSVRYNKVVRRNCVKHAMINILKTPPTGFKSIIRNHFYLKKDAIFSEVRQWAREDPEWNGEHVMDGAEYYSPARPSSKTAKKGKGKGKSGERSKDGEKEEGEIPLASAWGALIWELEGLLNDIKGVEGVE
ncbi:Baculoviral IAP repeat-containing protein 6 [Rhizophlyctis rosea]|nr:Baculoviral IAP repeat-containing protein 6 [Rhizophlyctis rosea]